MTTKVNDFSLCVATVNGSGSMSSNQILLKSLFRSGIPVGGQNLFPSNIAGLPTWFTIRANPNGYVSRQSQYDFVVALNPQTVVEDISTVKPGGFFFYSSELKNLSLRSDCTSIAIPFRELISPVSDSVKLRKVLNNMIYVGVLGELLKLTDDVLHSVVRDQFQDKASVIDLNAKAIAAGRNWAKEQNINFPFQVKEIPGGNKDKIMIDGNAAAAIGLLFGGCTFAAWYPITPSSSLIENFESLAAKYRVSDKGQNTYAVVQAEDELASICMVTGAGWAGARAVTATSGPGLSLMAEAAGLSYYAEVPAVIWDVQRVGPSTGLPTRTMQGDIRSGYHLSHGDVEHILLLPASPADCFEFGQTAFDLAERLQTLVIVMSDLDLGMNLHMSKDFQYPTKPFDRGKVLSREDLDRLQQFSRYKDVDGDGIGYRTKPGTEHPKAAYFTRGTGHDENAAYTENAAVYEKNILRLKKKWQTAKTLVPKPVLDSQANAKVGIIAFGTTDAAMPELRAILTDKGMATDYMRLRALPCTTEVEEFIKKHNDIVVIEQNRDAQMCSILRSEYPQFANRIRSVRCFDGLPVNAETLAQQMLGGLQ